MKKILRQLDKSQRRGLTVLCSNDGGAVWHRVGTGKTRITYAWFATIAKHIHEGSTPYFVVVCRRKAFADWAEEIEKLGLDWTVCDFEKYGWNRITRRPRVFLVSHAMLHKLLPQLLELRLTAVAYDEGYLYKRVSTKHCKAAHKLSAHIGRAAILSGSMMTARNLEDIYGQLYAIGKESVLARTLTEFRSKFMFALRIGPAEHQRFMQVAQAGAPARVGRAIRDVASVYFPESTRKIRDIERKITPAKLQEKYFNLLKKEYYLEIGERSLDIKSSPSLIIKCQQISDGFLIFTRRDPETRKVIEKHVEYFGSPKLDALLDKVQELVACGERVLIWCAFRESVRIVLRSLQKLKIKAYGFVGGEEFDSKGWKQNGQVAVATVDCGSSVNHFSQCAHSIYYSLTWKWLSLQQSQGRSDRKDSRHHTCFYYYFYTRGSLDRFVHQTALSAKTKEQQLIAINNRVTKWLTQKSSHSAPVKRSKAIGK